MKCRLCQQESELQNSHIISEAFWRGLYNEKHKALPISLDNNDLKPLQKGIREKLLCSACEGKFSKWENTLKRDLVDFGNLSSNFLNIKKVKRNLIFVEGIRYKNFKLSVLSLLWRMSISSDPFYSSYQLGPYDETLRSMLHSEINTNEKQFPISVSRYELDGAFYPDILMGFPQGKYSHVFTVQKFVISGHCFTIFVNNKTFPNITMDAFLRETGNLYIDIRSLVELASPSGVISRIFDKDVENFYTT